MVKSSERVSKIFANIESNAIIKTKPDAIILGNATEPHLDASFFYITGFPYGLFEGSYLIATRDGKITLLTSPLEEEIARSHSNGIEIRALAREDLSSVLGQVAGSGIKSLGINSSELTVKSFETIRSAFKSAQLVDVSDAFEAARAVKDQSEIQLIQKACDIASNVYGKIPSMLKIGTTESEVAAGMAYEMQCVGGGGVSFDSIIAFGKNSAEPHYSAGTAKLKRGQFVLCDYGTKYKRYCSDITRTLVYGKASKQQRKMYEVVLDALNMGKELCTTANSGAEVNAKVTKFIDSTEYKGRFIHSLGHSLGLAVHDGPCLSKGFERKLAPGMVVTVEPGIYIPGVGGVRIEDDVLITRGKPRILTSAKRELIEV